MVFGRTINYAFVNYDDDKYVYDNPDVLCGPGVQAVTWAFTHVHASNWHPLTWISHQLDCQIHGKWAGGHHLTSVLLHAATAVSLLFVMLQMTGRFWHSAVVVTLFAVHPLRVESVAWVAERKDVLSGLLFVLALGAYAAYAARPFSWGRYLTVVLLFALGLMAKPMLVTLPLLLLLLDYWPLQRFAALPAARLILEKLPLVGLSAASCCITVLAQTRAMAETHYPLAARLENAIVAYVSYLEKFIWPARLAVLYPHPGSELSIIRVVGSALVLTAVTAVAVAWSRKRPYFIVGWLWYLVMLLPVIGIVQAGMQGMADRYTYLPQIGLVVALVWGGEQACCDRFVDRNVLALAAAAWIVGLMAVAWRQTGVWRDSESLWRHALACTSANPIALGNLATFLDQQGRLDESIAEGRELVRIEPDYAPNHFDLALTLARAGRIQEAIACYKEALRLQPDYLEAENCLANQLRNVGKCEEAASYYTKAMRAGPEGAPACNNYGSMLVAEGKINQAVQCFRQAIEHDPTYLEAYNNLGKLLLRSVRTAEAISCYERAVALKPDFAEARTGLGLALVRAGRIREAAAQFQQVALEKPDDAAACCNLANAMNDLGEMEPAVACYQKALRLAPQSALAHENLGNALMRLGRLQEAIEHFEQAARRNDVNAGCRLVWLLAAGEPTLGGDPCKALIWATRLKELSQGRSAAVLDALAAAYAANRRFSEAAASAQRALAIAVESGDSLLAGQIRQHLLRYRQEQACRGP
jgi:tetratricopeptide (TPR) repeat protein